MCVYCRVCNTTNDNLWPEMFEARVYCWWDSWDTLCNVKEWLDWLRAVWGLVQQALPIHAPSRPLQLLLDGHSSHYQPLVVRKAAKSGVIISVYPRTPPILLNLLIEPVSVPWRPPGMLNVSYLWVPTLEKWWVDTILQLLLGHGQRQWTLLT